MTNSELSGIRVRRKMRSLLAIAFFFLVSGVVVSRLHRVESAEIQMKVVTLDVAVIDQNERQVTDLTKDEFTVYEDGMKQQINSLSSQESPVSLGIVIDSSGSMRAFLPVAQKMALNVIGRMKESDEAFIAQFKAEPELIQAFTSNQRDLANALGCLYTSGGTGLFDAIVATADHAYENGKSRRKALLFITDGLEKNSFVKEDDVLTALIENQAQAYFIYLPGQETPPSSRKSTPRKARELLDRLARASGGQAYFPITADEAISMAEKIAENLRRQYEITYVPANEKQDGALRKVNVVVSPKDGRQLNVSVRQSYFAAGHKRAVEKEAEKKKKGEKKK